MITLFICFQMKRVGRRGRNLGVDHEKTESDCDKDVQDKLKTIEKEKNILQGLNVWCGGILFCTFLFLKCSQSLYGSLLRNYAFFYV